MLIEGGVSYCISFSIVSYLYVSCSGSITSVGEERAIFLLLFAYNYVYSVGRDFLFLLVLRVGCVILLWHSLGLPYNYFICCYCLLLFCCCFCVRLSVCLLLPLFKGFNNAWF